MADTSTIAPVVADNENFGGPTADQAANANALLATTPTVPTPAPATPTTINSGNTTPVTPIAYTTPNPTPIPSVTGLDTTVTPPPTPTVDSAQTLTSQLEDLNNSLEGKSAAETAAEATLGVPDLEATQTDLSSKLTGLQNEANAIPLQLQQDATGRGITADGLAPMQTARLRTNAIAALGVSTLLAATKGQIATAQAQAAQQVAAIYDPIQEKITAATANLKLIMNSPEYSAEEKATAQAQLDTQNQKQAVLDKAKADATTVQNTAITAAQNLKNFTATSDYPTVSTALSAISNAKDPAAAAAIAQETGLAAPAKLDTSVVDVGGRKLLVNNQTGATVKDLGSSTTSTDSASAAAIANASSQLMAARGPDSYTDPNLYAKLRSTSSLSAADFDNRFGYLVNPLSTARLGISTASASAASFGAPSTVDKSAVMTALGKDPTTAATVDQNRLATDPQYFYWVKAQLGV